jgi:hypothetical protein
MNIIPCGPNSHSSTYHQSARPLETLGGAYERVAKSDSHPAPHFINYLFSAVKAARPL